MFNGSRKIKKLDSVAKATREGVGVAATQATEINGIICTPAFFNMGGIRRALTASQTKATTRTKRRIALAFIANFVFPSEGETIFTTLSRGTSNTKKRKRGRMGRRKSEKRNEGLTSNICMHSVIVIPL
jgi:hypothetical protein